MRCKNRSRLTLAIVLVLIISMFIVPQIGVGDKSQSERIKGKMGPDNSKIDRETVDSEGAKEEVLKDDYEKHDPIHIKGNENFTKMAEKEGWPGNGTEEEPYVIEGLKIEGEDENLIDIIRVTLHFIIRDNYLLGGEDSISLDRWSKNGIIKNNVIEGPEGMGICIDGTNMLVKNNFVESALDGIYLYPCTGSRITNNTLRENQIGIGSIGMSKNNTFVGNKFVDNDHAGLVLHVSHNNVLKQNKFLNQNIGVDIYKSNQNQLMNNTFYKNGIGFNVGLEPDPIPSTNNNILHNNNFIENEEQVVNRGANQYYNETLGQGNYWSNYEEKYPDAKKSNGAWNTPYKEENFTDKYPMVEPTVPYIQIEEPNEGMRTKERNVTVSWTARYRYKDELKYEVKVDKTGWKNVGKSTNHTIKNLSVGMHSFEVRVANVEERTFGGKMDFTVLGFNISIKGFVVEPLKGKTPLEVNVSAVLKNEGNEKGDISLYVDEKERKTWTLGSWEEVPVKESIKFEEAGTYLVGIGDKNVEITVTRPKPDISVKGFTVEPKEGKRPLQVEISAEVNNTGDAKGDISLYVGERKIRTWTVEPGENISINESFELTDIGNHTVKLGKESSVVKVNKQSEETFTRIFAAVGVAAIVVMAVNIYYLRSKKEG